MTDLEIAMAEFAAKNAVTVCEPITDAKKAKEVKRHTQYQADRERDAYERTERNAENMRYDSEGVYYIGGKLVETRYGY